MKNSILCFWVYHMLDKHALEADCIEFRRIWVNRKKDFADFLDSQLIWLCNSINVLEDNVEMSLAKAAELLLISASLQNTTAQTTFGNYLLIANPNDTLENILLRCMAKYEFGLISLNAYDQEGRQIITLPAVLNENMDDGKKVLKGYGLVFTGTYENNKEICVLPYGWELSDGKIIDHNRKIRANVVIEKSKSGDVMNQFVRLCTRLSIEKCYDPTQGVCAKVMDGDAKLYQTAWQLIEDNSNMLALEDLARHEAEDWLLKHYMSWRCVYKYWDKLITP